MKALVVDDSKLARVKLGKLLKERGIEVDTAESGEEAVERADRSPPNLIFMDHQMPNMDGIEAMKRIKSNPKTQHVPVIMCTGQDEPAFKDMAVANGAMGVLTKPPAIEDLDRLLSEAAIPEHPPTAEAAPAAAELQEILERITRIEAHLPASEQIEARIAAVSESLHTTIRTMEEQLEARLTRIVEESATPEIDTTALAEEAARQAGDQVARRLAQFEHRIKELETAVETALTQSASSADPAELAEQAAARIEAGVGKRLEPLERKLAELDTNLSAEIEAWVHRIVSEIPAAPAVLSDTELERVKAVAESAAQDAARQAVQAQEPPVASAISEELEASLRALSEQTAREAARAASQSEAQRVLEEHLQAEHASSAGASANDATAQELQALRRRSDQLQKQVHVAWAMAALAAIAAVVLPFVL